jgi:hypothetical protein
MLFLISVPIGAWHPLLPACLRSLSLQDGTVHVAVMDSSGDPRVAQALDSCGIPFAYRRHGADAGQAAAIIEGWAATEGDVLGWLNADDVLLPGAIGQAREALAAAVHVDAVHADSMIVDSAGAVIGVHGQTGPFQDYRSPVNPISQPSCFARRRAVEAAGGLNASLKYVMDWDLWVRMARKGSQFHYRPRYWSAVHWGAGTKTHSGSPRRLAELTRMALELAGPRAAARLWMGLATEGSSPGSLLWRYAARGAADAAAPGVCLGARPSPREQTVSRATLCIPNLTGASCGYLQVTTTGNARVQVHQPGSPADRPMDISGIATLALAAPCPPGGAVELTLESQGGRIRFERAELTRQ